MMRIPVLTDGFANALLRRVEQESIEKADPPERESLRKRRVVLVRRIGLLSRAAVWIQAVEESLKSGSGSDMLRRKSGWLVRGYTERKEVCLKFGQDNPANSPVPVSLCRSVFANRAPLQNFPGAYYGRWVDWARVKGEIAPVGEKVNGGRLIDCSLGKCCVGSLVRGARLRPGNFLSLVHLDDTVWQSKARTSAPSGVPHSVDYLEFNSEL